MASVHRPLTEDVEKWGLTGERAAQLGAMVRWVRTRLATHERESEATSRCAFFLGGNRLFSFDQTNDEVSTRRTDRSDRSDRS